jgi:CNT family concentrative nucleoside transporter
MIRGSPSFKDAEPRSKGGRNLQVLWGIGGIIILLAIAFLLSTNRRAIRLRLVIGALAIQIAFAFIVLYWDFGQRALQTLTSGVQAVIDTSNQGIQ